MEFDKEAKKILLGKAWVAETNSGQLRRREDVKFLRDHWAGSLVLKDIQNAAIRQVLLPYIVEPRLISFQHQSRTPKRH